LPVTAAALAELTGQVALVTGAAGNIGRAVCILLAKRGATVLGADRSAAVTGLTETVRVCEEIGTLAHPITFDVTDAQQVSDALEDASGAMGWPTLVFNNAGYQGDFASTVSYNPEDFRRVLDVNVTGAFTVMQLAARGMIARKLAGSVVNTASMAGVSGAPNMVAYSASKAAVIGMTRSAAKDLAPHNIRVNAVSPAFIGPGVMWDRQVELQSQAGSIYYDKDPDVVAEQMIGQVPMRRYGSLEEVAEVVAFLLSGRASYMTGTNTEITGGSQ